MQLLICIRDTGRLCKPGQVITGLDDGADIGNAVRQHVADGEWAVVSCDITPVEVRGLMENVLGEAPRIDVTDLPATLTRAELLERVLP